ncbi:hypothetical protein NTE_00739 [Candidatus Nitrososphaera evergladensis SR1]|uniref:Uncharacterized protein n=1 Tax=Candidatus Nitrososphaera evergladensis SR1 TaxID=1459636 RepID=A0A075MPP5_9ARCH|nr:hypothetical protein [Candidatus Nitrososphaera evergladensis]AIF82817.1 hypothetical protein NTE_00739 [Candidatus Nitrososphaera evergladensis SR1]
MSNRPQADPDTAAKYREKCNSILAISPRIRYAGVMNKFGRTLAGGLRKGVVPLLKPEEARNEYFIEATRSQLRKSFERSIGKTEYTFTENEKVKILTLTNEDNFYYLTMDKETPAAEVAKIIESAKKLAR